MNQRAPAIIVLTAHDPSWAARFADEAENVRAALGDVLLELHHIGSTAIPGIVAKPVIDMLAVVKSVEMFDGSPLCLEALQYEALGEFGIPGRRYFRKDSAAGARSHQLHAFAIGSADIERHVGFRDYLCAHPSEAQAYADLKTMLAKRHAADARAYNNGKSEFIREVEQRAATWRRELPGA